MFKRLFGNTSSKMDNTEAAMAIAKHAFEISKIMTMTINRAINWGSVEEEDLEIAYDVMSEIGAHEVTATPYSKITIYVQHNINQDARRVLDVFSWELDNFNNERK